MAKSKKKPVNSEDFYSISTMNEPRVHPDGKQIVYVKESPEFKGKLYSTSIWIIQKDGKDNRQFTVGGFKGDFSPRWSPDGSQLCFVSNRAGKPQIHIMRTDGGESLPLTYQINGAFYPVWSPDSKSICFISRTREEERNEEDRRKKMKNLDPFEAKQKKEIQEHEEEMRIDPRVYRRTIVKQGTAFRDDRNSHIYIQKLDTQSSKRLTDGNYDFSTPVFTPDGRYIIASTRQKGDVDISIRSDLVKISIKERTLEFLTDNENGNFYPVISPDGKWIYYLSFQHQEVFKQRVKIMRLAIEGGTPEELIPNYDYDPNIIQLSDDGSYLYFGISLEGRDRIFRVSVKGDKPEEVIAGNRMIGPFHLAGNTLAYRVESPDIPGDLYVSNANGKNQKRLTHLNKKFLSKRWLSQPEEIWYQRPDGTKVQGWIMKPYGYKKGGKYPWIVQVHGGPHIMWGFSWWHEYQSMCGKGYGVFYCNPRGSDGYGSEFKGAIHLKWGEEDSLDILAGADLMVAKGLADPDNLYLTGGSFGGFMTAWIVSHDHRFKAAAAQRGVYNFLSMHGASDALTLVEWEFDGWPWDNHDQLWDHSPLKYVKNVNTPLMIIHSELDFRVGISQAEELYVALKRLNKPAEFVRYPREGHELSRSGEPRHRVDRINRIIDWFDRHR